MSSIVKAGLGQSSKLEIQSRSPTKLAGTKPFGSALGRNGVRSWKWSQNLGTALWDTGMLTSSLDTNPTSEISIVYEGIYYKQKGVSPSILETCVTSAMKSLANCFLGSQFLFKNCIFSLSPLLVESKEGYPLSTCPLRRIIQCPCVH